jgi:S-DNA-T family DNA segregation ATPase FtsK/SpoIIIE
MQKLSEEMMYKISEYKICRNCRIVNKDLLTKRRHCPLCGSTTSPFKLEGQKKPDGKKRFPRELNPVGKKQEEIVKMITESCKNFDCPGQVTGIVKGPVVTEYLFTPDRFTRVKRLKSLNEDLALALSVETVTIRRIPGKPVVGVSMPNGERLVVTHESCFKNTLAHRYDMALPLNFGLTSEGAPYVEDLATFPHMLVGGSTGTGKSTLLKQIITSLAEIRTPSELRFAFVDPKQVELFRFKGLPHMLMPPEFTVWGCLNVMETLIQEMKRRTANLHVLKVNNIKELNDRLQKEADELKQAALKAKEGNVRKMLEEQAAKKMAEKWYYIVLVIDEMAEIVLEEKKEFTKRMASISQMARAAGICVITCTQRPSVDVVSGKIKVNFLGRAAFRMPDAVNSKTILGQRGAENLLGKGDMFILSPDKTGLNRIHVANCTDDDVNKMLQLSLEHGHENAVPADFMTENKVPPTPKPNGNGKATISKAVN